MNFRALRFAPADAAVSLRRFSDGGPHLRDQSAAEQWLLEKGLIVGVGHCWFEITSKGAAMLRRVLADLPAPVTADA